MTQYWPQLVSMQLGALANMPLIYIGFNLYHTTSPLTAIIVMILAMMLTYWIGLGLLAERQNDPISAPELLARPTGTYGKRLLIVLASCSSIIWATIHSGFFGSFVASNLLLTSNTTIIYALQFAAVIIGITLATVIPRRLSLFGVVNTAVLIILFLLFIVLGKTTAIIHHTHPQVSVWEAFKPVITLFMAIIIITPSHYRFAANNAECKKALAVLSFGTLPIVSFIGWLMAYVTQAPDLIICCASTSLIVRYVSVLFFSCAAIGAIASTLFASYIALLALETGKRYQRLLPLFLAISVIGLALSGVAHNILKGMQLAVVMLVSSLAAVVIGHLRRYLGLHNLSRKENLFGIFIGIAFGLCCYSGFSIIGTNNAMLDALLSASLVLLFLETNIPQSKDTI